MITKYRAWHLKEKKMYEVVGIDFENTTITLYEHSNLKDVPFRDVVLIQSIGQKDKNGKEIFRFDIVKHKNGFLYMVDFCPINMWWYLHQYETTKTGYTGGIAGQDMRLHMCEIIGNNFQKPKLLEENHAS